MVVSPDAFRLLPLSSPAAACPGPDPQSPRGTVLEAATQDLP